MITIPFKGNIDNVVDEYRDAGNDDLLVTAIEIAQSHMHGVAFDAGWWHNFETNEDMRFNYDIPYKPEHHHRSITEMITLMHSELSEAFEGYRKNEMDDHLPNRYSFEVELADLIIRVFDCAGGLGLNLAHAVSEKLQYNKNRPDHKIENRKKPGGKTC